MYVNFIQYVIVEWETTLYFSSNLFSARLIINTRHITYKLFVI